MERLRKRLIGGGALGLAGGFLGRGFLVWAFRKILGAFSGLLTGDSPKVAVPQPFPWADTVGIILMIVGLYFLVSSYRRPSSRPSLAPAGVAPPRFSRVGASKTAIGIKFRTAF